MSAGRAGPGRGGLGFASRAGAVDGVCCVWGGVRHGRVWGVCKTRTGACGGVAASAVCPRCAPALPARPPHPPPSHPTRGRISGLMSLGSGVGLGGLQASDRLGGGVCGGSVGCGGIVRPASPRRPSQPVRRPRRQAIISGRCVRGNRGGAGRRAGDCGAISAQPSLSVFSMLSRRRANCPPCGAASQSYVCAQGRGGGGGSARRCGSRSSLVSPLRARRLRQRSAPAPAARAREECVGPRGARPPALAPRPRPDNPGPRTPFGGRGGACPVRAAGQAQTWTVLSSEAETSRSWLGLPERRRRRRRRVTARE